MKSRTQVKNSAMRQILRERASNNIGSIYPENFSSPPPNALIKRNADIECRDIVTTPTFRREPRTPLSQIHSSKRPSRLRSIYSQSPGATLLTQKPLQTPLRKIGGRNNIVNGLIPSRVPRSARRKISIVADGNAPETATPLPDRHVSFSSKKPETRLISNNNLHAGNQLYTPRQSALKSSHSLYHLSSSATKDQQQSITSPLAISDESATALHKSALRRNQRTPNSFLSSGPSRVRVKQNPVAKRISLQQNSNTCEQIVHSTASSRTPPRKRQSKVFILLSYII